MAIAKGFLVITAIAVTAMVNVSLLQPPVSAAARLDAYQLAKVFGDSGSCTQTDTCRFQVVDGSNCAYCDTATNRVFCCDCPGPAVKSCTYSGGVSSCNGATKMVGAMSGQPGACGSCTTTSGYTASGSCMGLVDGRGDACGANGCVGG